MQACEVSVWSASTDDFGEAECAALAAVLDPEELSRLERLRNDADRRAWLLAHAVRRKAIAQALGIDAGDLRFTADAHGQPGLAWPTQSGLFFSLAHARQAVVCAVTRAGPVGVDIEFVQGEADFSLLEPFVVMPEGTESDGPGQFFHYWTALEAFWKAHGLGLSAAHPRLRLRPGGAGTLDVSFEHDAPCVRRARLMRLAPRSGCAITLALREPSGLPLARDDAGPGTGDTSAILARRPQWPRRYIV